MKKLQILLFFLLFWIMPANHDLKAFTPSEAQERSALSFPLLWDSDPNQGPPPALSIPVGKSGISGPTSQTSGYTPRQQWSRTSHSHQVFNHSAAEIHTHLKRGTVFVRPKAVKTTMMVKQSQKDPDEQTREYLSTYPDIFNLDDPQEELELQHSRTDRLGMKHLTYQQKRNNIPVWGRQMVSHFDTGRQLKSMNCLLEPTQDDLKTTPVITEQEAIEIAQKAFTQNNLSITLSSEEMESLDLAPKAELCFWNRGWRQNLILVWVVEIHPNLLDWQRFFIQAEDGTILESYNATVSNGPVTAQAKNLAGETVTVHTYQIDNQYYMLDGSLPMFVEQTSSELINDAQGVILTVNADYQDLTSSTTLSHFISSTNTWTDAAAVSAQDSMRLTYEFYYHLSNYARNSFDDAGATMMTVLHVTEDGQAMDNAYWNGSFVVLGDGLELFKPLAGGLDVIAHEFTHAVVQYTANLEYQYESGALNETYADIGGILVDSDNFTLGEDIIKSSTYYPTGALRDMANPHNGGSSLQDTCWQPATMDEYQNLSLNNDNGGVHINSGITNFAAYKIMSSLGRTKGEQILFRALFYYLTSQSDFTDFRLAAVQAAEDLYGSDSTEQEAVTQAFDEVGITEGSGTTPPSDNPVVPGLQYIIGVENGMDALVVSNGFSDISELESIDYLGHFLRVNTGSGRPISVDRYGEYIYVVDWQHNLRRIKPDGTDEKLISSYGNWWSVAVSPSGRQLALTRFNPKENAIWVYDLTDDYSTPTKLTLMHPTTTSDNTYSDIVEYADTMVFLDEQTIAYDCYNTIQSPGEGTISFWDVNVINVDSGVILSVIPPQPDGVDVGNPTIASTNSSVLCVDMINQDNQDSVVGINLVSGDVGTILENGSSIAYPHYSPDDSQMVFSRTGGMGRTDVYRIDLEENKITSSGTAEKIIYDITLPVWFVVGSQPTATLSFLATASSGSENDLTFTIPVTLSDDCDDFVTVDYAATGGTALNGTDYTITAETLTFNPGITTQYITGTIDNHHLDEDQTIVITLSNPTNALLGTDAIHTFTILAAGDSNSFLLNTTVSGGHATIEPENGSYEKDTVVALTITPEAGYRVKTWQGSDNDSSRETSNCVTMDSDKSVTVEIASIISPRYCTIKAKSKQDHDSIVFKGQLIAGQEQLDQATECAIKIWSSDSLIYEENISSSLFKVKNANYIYTHSLIENDTRKITYVKLDVPDESLVLKLRQADLTGLTSPVLIDVVMGDYSGLAEVDETIINQSDSIPLRLLNGYRDALRIDKVKFTATSLSIKGQIAVENPDIDLTQYPMTISWDSQDFVIPLGGFTKNSSQFVYKDRRGEYGSISRAAFDLESCDFQLTIKNTVIDDPSGSVLVGIQLDTFDQTDDYDLD